MTDREHGISLELHFVDGNPEGMVTVETLNWTGHVLKAPRTQITKALERSEAKRTGVYLLLGERNGLPCAYIGEGEKVRERIRQHTNKDWWTSFVVITTTGGRLHKAHAKYLEASLVRIAREIGSVTLANNQNPSQPNLSHAQIDNMEDFLHNLRMILPAMGIDLFLSRKRSLGTAEDGIVAGVSVEFELKLQRSGIEACAVLNGSEFIVKKGSKARKNWVSKSKNSYYKKLREKVEKEVLSLDDNHLFFEEDYAFTSPSAAGAVVTGRISPGPTEWFVKNENKTYKQWEEEQLASSIAPSDDSPPPRNGDDTQ